MNVKLGNSATRDDIDSEKVRMDDDRYWERADDIARDPDRESALTNDDGIGVNWGKALVITGGPDLSTRQKQQVTVRLDSDVLEWFKAQGKGYQTRMNAVLRHYMEHQKKAG